ncbi:MAG: hypothetical protein U0359_42510 [Byssovorax sp.]
MKRALPRPVVLLTALLLSAALGTSLVFAGNNPRDQAREAAASAAYAAYEAQYANGTVTLDTVYLWSVRWMDSEKKTKAALPAAQAHLARMRALQASVKSRANVGLASGADGKASVYYTAEAEAWVVDAGGTP